MVFTYFVYALANCRKTNHPLAISQAVYLHLDILDRLIESFHQ